MFTASTHRPTLVECTPPTHALIEQSATGDAHRTTRLTGTPYGDRFRIQTTIRTLTPPSRTLVADRRVTTADLDPAEAMGLYSALGHWLAERLR